MIIRETVRNGALDELIEGGEMIGSDRFAGDAMAGGPDLDEDAPEIVLVDHRPLTRHCLVGWFVQLWNGCTITPVATAAEAIAHAEASERVELVVLSIGAAQIRAEGVLDAIDRLVPPLGGLPLVVLADQETVEDVALAIEHGVRGYVPTSMSLAEAAEAIRFVRAGGTFVPASVLVRVARPVRPAEGQLTPSPELERLTRREREVLNHLCQGKPNKIIAHDLCIKESTVKVFVRRIMTKLQASNRTELAYMVTRQQGLQPTLDTRQAVRR
jgi:DNA-binding NarL/FixJ family response regulator